MKTGLAMLCSGIILLYSGSVQAQLSAEEKQATIDSIAFYLNKHYVFPETAEKAVRYLKEEWTRKAFDSLRHPEDFATALTRAVQSVTHDKHLQVGYSAQVQAPQLNDPMETAPEEREAFEQWLLTQNYGVREVKVLPGNIGYLDFSFFCDPEVAGDTYTAAMNYIQHSQLLIIDLRNCSGSMSEKALPFLCSYFFAGSVHLNDFYWRAGNRTVQTWTQPVVPGKKYLHKPIYVLTSAKTFSGAEELAYDLQQLKRATLIGEVTGGGANPGGTVRISDHYNMFIPFGRAINPITQTNWEGTGVRPDTLIRSQEALYKATLMALEYLVQLNQDNPHWNGYLQDQLQRHLLKKPVYLKHRFRLKGFGQAGQVAVAGTFNNWSASANLMTRTTQGWEATIETEPGSVMYKLVVDGRWMLDPANPNKAMDGKFGNSVVEIR